MSLSLATTRLREIVDSPRRWALWSQPPRLIGYCLLIELAAFFTTLAASRGPAQWHDAAVFGVLACIGIAQAELSRRVGDVRRRVNSTPHINMSSVWTFGGVLLLPPMLIAALVAVLYGHLAVRSPYRVRRVPPFRTVFNASLVVMTCLTARGVLAAMNFPGIAAAMHHGSSGFIPVAASAVTYFVVGALIVIPGLNLESRSLESLFGSVADNCLELTTLCLGAINAVLLVAMPELAIAIVPPMLLLERSALVKQLEIAATTDDKTGVFNTAGWHHLATRELDRATRTRAASMGILMIDMDHFKQINDRHGHLAGDDVLKSVAGAIAGQVRAYDSVGRFGGEEFVVLLPGATKDAVCTIAERIRQAISTVKVTLSRANGPETISGLSVSIGVAMYPSAGSGLDGLLHAADTALYSAKNGGRNRVVTFSTAA